MTTATEQRIATVAVCALPRQVDEKAAKKCALI